MDDLTPFERTAAGEGPNVRTDDGLYERDFFEWTRDQAERLRRSSAGELDRAHLAEEIEDLGNRDRREVLSHATLIVQHLLKAQYQPVRETRSWASTIRVQRRDLRRVLKQSPSLRQKLEDGFAEVWSDARIDASDETGLLLETFPETPSFSLDQALDDEFVPAPPANGGTD